MGFRSNWAEDEVLSPGFNALISLDLFSQEDRLPA